MINILAAIAGTAYSAYTDLKTGEVPEWLTNSMIIAGFAWTLFNYNLDMLWWIWATAGIVFGAGYLMYLFGEIGGGDVKLFTGLALLVPFYGHEIYPFIIPVFFLSGILFMLSMPITYFKKIIKRRKEIKDFKKKIRHLALLEIIFLGFGTFWMTKFALLGLMILPLMVGALILPFKNDIAKMFFVEEKNINEINEEDVIALENMDENIKKKLGLWRKTLTSFEIKKLKEKAEKQGIKKIFVLENLPKYVPYILASLIINLVFGDFIMSLFTSFI